MTGLDLSTFLLIYLFFRKHIVGENRCFKVFYGSPPRKLHKHMLILMMLWLPYAYKFEIKLRKYLDKLWESIGLNK